VSPIASPTPHPGGRFPRAPARGDGHAQSWPDDRQAHVDVDYLVIKPTAQATARDVHRAD